MTMAMTITWDRKRMLINMLSLYEVSWLRLEMMRGKTR